MGGGEWGDEEVEVVDLGFDDGHGRVRGLQGDAGGRVGGGVEQVGGDRVGVGHAGGPVLGPGLRLLGLEAFAQDVVVQVGEDARGQGRVEGVVRLGGVEQEQVGGGRCG